MIQMDRLIQSRPRTIRDLLLTLLLAHCCRGQFQLIGQPQPVTAKLGSDVILPCHLQPTKDVSSKTLEWTRPDLNPKYVFVQRAGRDLINLKNPLYKGRTSVFPDEVKRGNISLKLSKVRVSDEGRYECYISDINKYSSVELVVGAASSAALSLTGINKGEVILQCDSTGWSPEPEVFWLDGEGNLLSAGPPETVRGPDGLYTVSSRVTVEKRHSNSFTCRVTQKKTKETREAQIQISDHFFEVWSSSTTVGLAVVVAFCILIILILVFIVWRQNKMKTKKSHREEADEGEKKNDSKRSKTEDQFVNEEEKEREQLVTGQTFQMEEFNKEKKPKKSKDQRREQTDNRVKTLKEELEAKKTEVEMKQSELQQLHEEVQKNEENVKTVKGHLEQRNKEDPRKTDLQKKKKEVKNEVDDLKQQLEKEVTELHFKNQKIHVKQGEVQQLQDEIQRMLTDLHTLMKELESNYTKLATGQAAPDASTSPSSWWPLVSRQTFQQEQQRRKEEQQKREEEQQRREEEQQRREDAENKLRALEEEQQRRKEAESQLQIPEEKLQMKVREANSSDTGFIVEVNDDGKYIRLVNLTGQDQLLEGWKVRIFVNNEEPRTFKFGSESFLKLDFCVCFKVSSGQRCPLPNDKQWTDLRSWKSADKLQVIVISKTKEEIQCNSFSQDLS